MILHVSAIQREETPMEQEKQSKQLNITPQQAQALASAEAPIIRQQELIADTFEKLQAELDNNWLIIQTTSKENLGSKVKTIIIERLQLLLSNGHITNNASWLKNLSKMARTLVEAGFGKREITFKFKKENSEEGNSLNHSSNKFFC